MSTENETVPMTAPVLPLSTTLPATRANGRLLRGLMVVTDSLRVVSRQPSLRLLVAGN